MPYTGVGTDVAVVPVVADGSSRVVAAIEEAVIAAGVPVKPADLARVVDAVRLGVGARGIVEGGIGIDRHDLSSSMIVSL
jgi:hypothetical protein